MRRRLRRTTTKAMASCGMWHVVSAAIECGDCVAFPVCSCQNAKCKMQNAVLMNSKLIRTICPLSAAAEPATAAAAH